MKSRWEPNETYRWKKTFFVAARSALPIILIAALFMGCGDAPKAMHPVFYRPMGFWLTGLVIVVAIPALAFGIIYLIGILAREPEQEPERTIEEIIKGDKPVLKLDWAPLPTPPKPAPKISKTALVSAAFGILGILCFVAFAILIRHPDQAPPDCTGVFCEQSPGQVAGKFAFNLFFFFEILTCLLGLIAGFQIFFSENRLKGLSIAGMAAFVSLVLMIFWRYFGYF